MALQGQDALVTGASRGIGQGIALQLGEAKATVYVTGRRPEQSDGSTVEGLPNLEQTAQEITDRGGKGIVVYVDHSDMEQVKELFARIERESHGRLDILVNNAFSAAVPSGSDKVSGKKFYEVDPEHWDTVNNVGLRNHYFCSVYAAKIMTKNGKGLIVNVSSRGGLMYMFSVPYGVGKCALDRMAADMAVELKSSGVTCVSLWPGPVRTQLVLKRLENKEFAKSPMGKTISEAESPEFAGKAVVALASDEKIMSLTGRVLTTADLADHYGFADVNGESYECILKKIYNTIMLHGGQLGRRPLSVRSAPFLLRIGGHRLADWLPPWIKVPGWLIAAWYSPL